jgi:hypothetical protein
MAGHLSPEQARRRAVDKRTDIWAFGVVLFEMLTGRRLFDGETVSDTVAAVLKSDPDWTELPAETPDHVRVLLARCLERDPSRRLRDIGEARLTLDTSRPPVATTVSVREMSPSASPAQSGSFGSSSVVAPAASTARRWQVAAGVLALTTATLAAYAWWQASEQPGARVETGMELAIAPPTDGRFEIGSNSGNVILSPDGTRIAFVATVGGAPTIWVRSLAADDARPSGTEAAVMPFWSPDGRRVGFFAAGKLLTVDVAGGLPEPIADAAAGRGAAWGSGGTIVTITGEVNGTPVINLAFSAPVIRPARLPAPQTHSADYLAAPQPETPPLKREVVLTVSAGSRRARRRWWPDRQPEPLVATTGSDLDAAFSPNRERTTVIALTQVRRS